MSIESAVSALPGDIVAWLQTQSQLDDITFMTEFPAVKKAIPLQKVIVAIGLQSVRLTDKFEADGNGVLQLQEYCRTAQMRISLSVHVPFSLGGHTCHEVFSNVTDALTFQSDLNIKESGCDKIQSDRDTDALVLTGYLQIESDFCPAISSGMQFQSFFDKELLCGSHIRDTSIHTTAAEKNLWMHPAYAGRYNGTGSSSNTIGVGFKPSYVSVFAADSPPVEKDASTGLTTVYTAQAVTGACSQGIRLTNTGFTVSNNSRIGDCVSSLNEAGVTYGYLALR